MLSSSSERPCHSTVMSLFKSKRTIFPYWQVSAEWTIVDEWTEIPPNDDALKIRFLFLKETNHAFRTREDVCEGFEIPQTEKVIIIRPSESCSNDTASIKRSSSIRKIEYFINTEFPPSKRETKRPRIIELVQNEMGSPPLPPNRVIDVKLSDGIVIVHDTSDKKGLVDYMEATGRGNCVICMEDFEFERNASRLPCLHIFHGTCIVNWLQRNHTCPSCRYSIPPNLITWF